MAKRDQAAKDAAENQRTPEMQAQAEAKGQGDDPVATHAENLKLEHSAGGTTTRDDAFDLGVPMLPGSPDEPVGPEDALGPSPKRGDYSGRIGPETYHPHEGATPQRPNAEERGDVEGKKGGVETEGE